MRDWNGREVASSVSQGGVHLMAVYSDNMIRDEAVPWPPPPIVQKLCQSRAQMRFVQEVLADLTGVLSYYSNLQPIHSEDAITYSYFGSLMNRPPRDRAHYLDWLLRGWASIITATRPARSICGVGSPILKSRPPSGADPRSTSSWTEIVA